MTTPRDIALAVKAKRHGASYSLRIIIEARRAGIPISLGFALVEQESAFRNVFGHDPTIYVGAGTVTKGKYLAYRKQRGPSGAGGMQGVGPCQLTWWSTQDAADKLGGCWKPASNIRQAFTTLARNIADDGPAVGIQHYNGSGPAAVRYSDQVRAKAKAWHRALT